MKSKFIAQFAVFALALAGALSVSTQAQTTKEGPGPSEQPSAPMEIGQVKPAQQADQTAQPAQPQAAETPKLAEEAQPGGPSGEAAAKTDQGVGRVSMIHGDVSTQRGDSGTWSAAVLNQPVVNGDKVSTGAGGRAEVQLDYANILRLGSNAQANIARFTDKYIQIQVGQGLANYSVFGESDAEPEIDTPNVAVHPAHKDGVFRIEVRPDGDSIVIVRKGEAEISTPQGIGQVKQGEMATVRGSGADAKYKISAAPERDDWDRWNSERDRMIHEAAAWKHTNKYYVGAEDLDANGTWEDAPDYGQVWVPNEPEGWVPYRDGNWVWEPYYGWTWVGFEPWGWAPYHYGRWMWYGGAWAWWPGPVWGGFYRPFWAPAYVSFFGFGGGWGWGFGWGGWGGFGWLPIGPCDRFFPWWGGYRGRFGVVGVNRFGTLNRFGGIAPLHAGTRFSNLAHVNDAHIGGALSTVGAGKFGAGGRNWPNHGCGGHSRAVEWRSHDDRQHARGTDARQFVGQRTGCGAFHHSQQRVAAFLRHAEHVASGIVPAADGASAAVHAAEPLLARGGWRKGDGSGRNGVSGHDGCRSGKGRCCNCIGQGDEQSCDEEHRESGRCG